MDTLQKIYGEVADAQCKGLCQEACSIAPCHEAESKAIAAKHGSAPQAITTPDGRHVVCDKLVEGRCSIYEDRPLICRGFGTTRRLRCPFGCAPAGGFTPERKFVKLMFRVEKL